MTRTPTPPAAALSATGIARTLDEALALLEPRFPETATDNGTDMPLPSLLDRCEALLSSGGEPVPARVVLDFAGTARSGAAAFLELLPNLRIMRGTPVPERQENAFFPFAAAGLDPALRADAAIAAFSALEAGCHMRGEALLLHLDARPGYDRLPGDGGDGGDLVARLRQRGPLAGLILAGHPLRSWLEMLHYGEAGYQPARLEDYAARYLAFLRDHQDLPLITEAQILGDPAGTLARIAAALALSADALQCVETALLDPADFWPAPDPEGPMLHDITGAPATEEPLDSPAYVELCGWLGYAPDDLPRPPQSCAPSPRQPLSPRSPAAPRADGPIALIARLRPRLDLLAARERPGGSPRRQLDGARLTELVEDCLGHPDGFYERLDQLLAGLSRADGALLQIGCAAHYASAGQGIHGLGLLAEAVETMPPDDRELQLMAAEQILRLQKTEPGFGALTLDARTGPLRLPEDLRGLLESSLSAAAPGKTAEHGHSLLMDHLAGHPPAALDRPRLLIEIGTTRERVPGQGSTEKLATLCAELGIDFVTVDMDARNSAMARRMFRRLGLPFRAVTGKGEDFLAAWDGPIDYCFLDAYDFDHGNHSELRQSRYETFLGSRISDAQCHQMHLDCAHSLVAKLTPDGVICFDDTWTDEDGLWTAKGKTAMPYLLEQGFRVTMARNRAALLVRG